MTDEEKNPDAECAGKVAAVMMVVMLLMIPMAAAIGLSLRVFMWTAGIR